MSIFSRPYVNHYFSSVSGLATIGLTSKIGAAVGGWQGIQKGRDKGHGWARAVLFDGGLGGSVGGFAGPAVGFLAHAGAAKLMKKDLSQYAEGFF